MKSSVLLMTYRKPEFINEILSLIEDHKPNKIYISQDFKLSSVDEDLHSKVRNTLQNFSFQSPVEFIFHEKHLAVNDVFQKTLDYVFLKEERLIVLEDDIIPHPSFFNFCDVMLEKYEHTNVGSVLGCNLEAFLKDNSYILTDFNLLFWGWATWRGKWQLTKKINWETISTKLIDKIINEKEFYEAFLNYLDESTKVWDLEWGIKQMLLGFNFVLPCVNLIKNKGFLGHGTFTAYEDSLFSEMESFPLNSHNLTKGTNPQYKFEYQLKLAKLLQEILLKNKVDIFN